MEPFGWAHPLFMIAHPLFMIAGVVGSVWWIRRFWWRPGDPELSS